MLVQQGVVCCHFNCPPLTSSNGFTFLGLAGTNILYVHTSTHTKHMEVATSVSRSTIKRDTSISCHRCYESAHCSQLRVNWHIFFLPFTDRQAQQLFLPLHKSRDCFHTPPTGTVPFIKEIYLETNRGKRQRSVERWALIKSFNENVWGSVCYFITTQPASFFNRMGRAAACCFQLLSRSWIKTTHFKITMNCHRWVISKTQLVSITAVELDEQVIRLWPRHLCVCQWQLAW